MKHLWILALVVILVQWRSAALSADVHAYLDAAQQAEIRARAAERIPLAAEGSYREAAALAQLALTRAHTAGWNREECRAIEELMAVYGGQRDYAAVANLFRQGPLRQTNDAYDVAIEGSGFLRLTAPDGSVYFTRNGQLHYNPHTTQLCDAEGNRLGIAVAVDMTNLEIGVDGLVSGTRLNGDGRPETLGHIQLALFADSKQLHHDHGMLFRESAGSGKARMAEPGKDGAGTLAQGHLEDSWVP